MSKRGDAARESVKNTIINAFGDKFVAFIDKKIYVEAQDGPGGESIQFAVTLTMPKNTIARNDAPQTSTPADSDGWSGPFAPAPQATEISDDDKAKVQELMLKLGLSD